jgi:hypothetical protein
LNWIFNPDYINARGVAYTSFAVQWLNLLMEESRPPQLISMRRIVATWWPLAASWLLMALEGPAQSVAVARLPHPEINLAAYGGIVFALSLIIESPILMLLSASTALSKDWASYQRIRRFMMTAGAVMTLVHILIAFTSLYDLLAVGVIGAPTEIIEPGRMGLRIMLPWTWSIAYRRFHQGVLIRFGHSRAVGQGTLVRLAANLTVLISGYLLGTLPGIVVAASAVITGVISEAIFVGILVRPVLKHDLFQAPPVDPALTWKAFYAFYIPLALTSLISLLASPIGSAALSRMPRPLESLAVFPVVTGLTFMIRSFGIAFNEVVVALLDETGSSANLRRFTAVLAVSTTGFLLLIAATPLAGLWFSKIVGLAPELAELARKGVWIVAPLPALNAMQSWYTGAIMYGRKTRGITEAVVIYLATSAVCMVLGVWWGRTTGIYIGLVTLLLSMLTQTCWLFLRSRAVMRSVVQRDQLVMQI